jgi:hypothetical protein
VSVIVINSRFIFGQTEKQNVIELRMKFISIFFHPQLKKAQNIKIVFVNTIKEGQGRKSETV